MASNPQKRVNLVSRSHDADAINRVCNHPAVLPTLGLDMGEVDVAELLVDHRNVAFLGEYGGALFHWTAPHTYAAHDFFLPEGRGGWALRASREMLDRIFDDHGAKMVWAQTPVENRACRMFNRWLGFASEGVTVEPLVPGGNPVPIETFIMERR